MTGRKRCVMQDWAWLGSSKDGGSCPQGILALEFIELVVDACDGGVGKHKTGMEGFETLRWI